MRYGLFLLVLLGACGGYDPRDAVREAAPAGALCLYDPARREAVCFQLDNTLTRCSVVKADAGKYSARCGPPMAIAPLPAEAVSPTR